RFAEAVNRLDLTATDTSKGLPELVESVTSGGARSKTRGVVEGAKETLTGGGEEKAESRSRRHSS
ncbi:MAG: gas vesicle protein, partial [Thermoleophilaceae bacterium]|nr:gas vesicle protein [Thermoleophilaceae bacterium]